MMVLLSLKVMIKVIFFIFSLFLYSNAYSESTVKAGDSLIWDSENKSYTATGSVEFSNDTFIAFSEKMIAKYVEQGDKELFTVVELFENVRIELKDEIFSVSGRNTTDLEADLVIGAFGKRSTFDKELSRSFFSKRYPYIGVKYHINTDVVEHDVIELSNEIPKEVTPSA